MDCLAVCCCCLCSARFRWNNKWHFFRNKKEMNSHRYLDVWFVFSHCVSYVCAHARNSNFSAVHSFYILYFYFPIFLLLFVWFSSLCFHVFLVAFYFIIKIWLCFGQEHVFKVVLCWEQWGMFNHSIFYCFSCLINLRIAIPYEFHHKKIMQNL